MVALGLVITQVVWAEPPVADFSISDTAPEVGQEVTFDASASSDPDDEIVLYEWDFSYNGNFSADASGLVATTVTAHLGQGR